MKKFTCKSQNYSHKSPFFGLSWQNLYMCIQQNYFPKPYVEKWFYWFFGWIIPFYPIIETFCFYYKKNGMADESPPGMDIFLTPPLLWSLTALLIIACLDCKKDKNYAWIIYLGIYSLSFERILNAILRWRLILLFHTIHSCHYGFAIVTDQHLDQL